MNRFIDMKMSSDHKCIFTFSQIQKCNFFQKIKIIILIIIINVGVLRKT